MLEGLIDHRAIGHNLKFSVALITTRTYVTQLLTKLNGTWLIGTLSTVKSHDRNGFGMIDARIVILMPTQPIMSILITVEEASLKEGFDSRILVQRLANEANLTSYGLCMICPQTRAPTIGVIPIEHIGPIFTPRSIAPAFPCEIVPEAFEELIRILDKPWNVDGFHSTFSPKTAI